MNFNKDKFEEQFSEKNVLVEELIYENIKLFQQNVELVLDNNSLKEKVKKLEGSQGLGEGSSDKEINLNLEIVIGSSNHNIFK